MACDAWRHWCCTDANNYAASPITEVRVDTDAGWKTLTLDQPARRPLHVSRGDGTTRARRRRADRRRRRDADGHDAGDRQSAMRRAVKELPDPPRFQSSWVPRSPRTSGFPHGTNVEFAVVEAPDRVRIVIWERGVGPTHASGTGACASAIAAIAHGGAARDVEVIAPGGTQRVEWRDDGIYLTGWAEVVFDGHWVPSTFGPLVAAPQTRSFSDHSSRAVDREIRDRRAYALALAADRRAAMRPRRSAVKAA